jgi:hypothetical protein
MAVNQINSFCHHLSSLKLFQADVEWSTSERQVRSGERSLEARLTSAQASSKIWLERG